MPRNLAALLLATVVAAPAAAQSTGTPVYQAPYRAFATNELGMSLSDPGAGFALEGAFRWGFSRTMDLGIRGGIADGGGRNRGARLLAGADLRTRLLDHSESFPLDGSLTVGLGFTNGDGTTIGYLPIGFSMGRRILVEGSSVSLVPYLHPVLTPTFGDASEVLLSLGFGVDARITPRLDLRFSAAIGDQDGIAFTVSFLR